jgi:hypothetical protein
MKPEILHQLIKEEVMRLNEIIKPKDNTAKVGMILEAIVNIVALYLPDKPVINN